MCVCVCFSLQDLLQAVFGLHWNRVSDKWWRVSDWVKEMQPHFSHISETDSINSMGKVCACKRVCVCVRVTLVLRSHRGPADG